MPKIPDDVIVRLKREVPIVELAQRYGLEPRRVGHSFVARCNMPSHEDTTPSVVFTEDKNLFHDMGLCQKGGSPIDFVMWQEGATFPKAVRILCEMYFPEEARGLFGDRPLPRRRLQPPKSVASAPDTSLVEVESRAPRTAYLVRVVDLFQKELAINRLAQEYLESRGLVTREIWRALKLGFSSGSIEDLAGEEGSPSWVTLRELGILDADGKERMKGRVLFPLLALNQLPVGLYGRAVKPGQEPKHLFLHGMKRGFSNVNAGRRGKELLLVESPICQASLLEAQVHNALALCGKAIPPDLFSLLERFGIESVALGLDADEAGRKAALAMRDTFEEKGLSVRVIEWPEKDPNEVLVKSGPERLKAVVEALLAAPRACDRPATRPIETESLVVEGPVRVVETTTEAPAWLPAPIEATPVTSTLEPASAEPALEPEPEATREAVPEAPPSTDTAASPLLIASGSSSPAIDAAREEEALSSQVLPEASTPSTPDALTDDELRLAVLELPRGQRRWTVTWLESPSPAQIRANVTARLVSEGGTLSPGFPDTLNLLVSRAREAFARRASAILLPVEAKEDDVRRLQRLLLSDLGEIAELGLRRLNVLSAPKEETASVMSDDRRRRAYAYLLASHLLARMADDITLVGYVGEPAMKVLGLMVSISRKLPEALSMVILSSSGSGKSALADVLEKLTPEEDLLVVTRFTTASLYWMGKDAIKRKFVSIEERAGSQEADYAIRALQSKRKVTMMTPIKDQATGKIETKLFEVEGPASFLESTTESQIHHENATRCFEVRLDESPEQTRRIQEAQRLSRTLEGHRARGKAHEVAALHQDVQRLLRPIQVVIPFAHLLTFPNDSPRTRRDNPRFLNLLEVSGFVHQYQRPLRRFDTGALSDKLLIHLADEELPLYRVEATLADYEVAYTLAADLLYESLHDLKKPLRAFFQQVRDLFVETAKTSATRISEVTLLTRQIRERTHLPHHTVKRSLNELVELEYLAVTKGERGAPNGYRLVDLPEKKDGLIPGLLRPEDLLELFQRRAAS